MLSILVYSKEEEEEKHQFMKFKRNSKSIY